jgi:cytochrome oxidase Cu insertion factor (SCO1/SenC/PrrC family)
VEKNGQDIEVMHSDSVFLFDRDGHAREVMTTTSDEKALANDIATLMR